MNNINLVIFDWDNTLFPSSWTIQNLINLSENNATEKYSHYFVELDNLIYKLFVKIQKYSKIVIITNALPIWIKISSSVLPKTQALLKNIQIISARKDYQSTTNNVHDWKKLAFKKLIIEQINIISVGDAIYEYNALVNLYDKKKILKTIKFIDNPSYDSLIDQLNLLNNNIISIIKSHKHIDYIFNSFI
jgi:hypothetical protein